MHLQEVSPILWTKSIEETTRFYTEVLGFTAQSHFPDFVTLIAGEAKIMFIVPTGVVFDESQLTGSIYFFIDGVDALWEAVKEKAKIKTGICDREYLMRDFSVFDNNGYEIVFGEDISRR
jgi:catechol 2,3-dioxygenase-like lactoylglutathione lyase family enzyme